MQQYSVTGMSCAACSARVEKAVSAVPGVSSCAVSLLTNSMGVEGTAEESAIIRAVEAAGYGASVKGSVPQSAAPDAGALEDHETPRLRARLFWSLGFLVVLMVFSMGHNMWGVPLPAFFEGNPVAVGLMQMLLAAIVMIINQRFFISGFKGLLHRAPNMDTLVAMGSMASFVWSVYVLFAMTGAVQVGDSERVHELSMSFYFESAAMILTLITVGKMLEARSKGKTTDALKDLMRLAPQTATLIRDGAEVTVPVSEVQKGDIFTVRPGESVPVDGRILEGSSALNESALTGESIPVDKTAGDTVSAATINQSGFLRCEATRVGEDTTLSQIIRMVSDAAATKAPIAKIADRVAGVFVPAVIGIAALTLVIWLLAGRSFGFALARGISVLVISCPCALGLATPVAIMVGNGLGAKNGILFRTAAALEETGRTQIAVLDKTGTITTGEPRVTDLLPADGINERELLSLAASLEKNSEHPLARAILQKQEELGLPLEAAESFHALPGNGLEAVIGGESVVGGSLAYIGTRCFIPESVRSQAEALASDGKTPLFFARGKALLGMIAVADTMKEEAPQAIRELQGMGIKVVMLTGDNERTARAIARQAGVDEIVAGVLPDGKAEVVRRLQTSGKVAMVGDGINDAPALTLADNGIAIGAGTDIAIKSANVVLMNSSLSDVPAAIRLSRATLRNIKENLFWAFIYNIIGIPLAAGLWIPIFGWTLNPMFGALAMSLSSFCVVTNALRLNLCKIHDPAHDRRIKPEAVLPDELAPKKAALQKKLLIEGMMCGHCEAHVKGALEAIPGVVSASASHKDGAAVVELSGEVDDAAMRAAVEEEGYTVTSIISI